MSWSGGLQKVLRVLQHFVNSVLQSFASRMAAMLHVNGLMAPPACTRVLLWAATREAGVIGGVGILMTVPCIHIRCILQLFDPNQAVARWL